MVQRSGSSPPRGGSGIRWWQWALALPIGYGGMVLDALLAAPGWLVLLLASAVLEAGAVLVWFGLGCPTAWAPLAYWPLVPWIPVAALRVWDLWLEEPLSETLAIVADAVTRRSRKISNLKRFRWVFLVTGIIALTGILFGWSLWGRIFRFLFRILRRLLGRAASPLWRALSWAFLEVLWPLITFFGGRTAGAPPGIYATVGPTIFGLIVMVAYFAWPRRHPLSGVLGQLPPVLHPPIARRLGLLALLKAALNLFWFFPRLLYNALAGRKDWEKAGWLMSGIPNEWISLLWARCTFDRDRDQIVWNTRFLGVFGRRDPGVIRALTELDMVDLPGVLAELLGATGFQARFMTAGENPVMVFLTRGCVVRDAERRTYYDGSDAVHQQLLAWAKAAQEDEED